MDNWLISPPIVFIIVFISGLLLSYLFSRLSCRPRNIADDVGKSYACGEENYNHTAQPDYSIFFPFAFFFTILHVIVLVVATIPIENMQTFAMALIYIIGAVLGLVTLLRR